MLHTAALSHTPQGVRRFTGSGVCYPVLSLRQTPAWPWVSLCRDGWLGTNVRGANVKGLLLMEGERSESAAAGEWDRMALFNSATPALMLKEYSFIHLCFYIFEPHWALERSQHVMKLIQHSSMKNKSQRPEMVLMMLKDNSILYFTRY